MRYFIIPVILGFATACSFEGEVDADIECTSTCEDEKTVCYDECETECVNADGDLDEACDTDCKTECDTTAEECTVTCSSAD